MAPGARRARQERGLPATAILAGTSLLALGGTPMRVVVCDNASTDGTETICRDFARRDSRVRYVRNERNLGAAANFNRAFAVLL